MNKEADQTRKKLRESFRSLQREDGVEILEWSPDLLSKGKQLLDLCTKSSDKDNFRDVSDVQDFVDDLMSDKSNAWIARSTKSEKIVGICLFRRWSSIKSRRNNLIKQDLKITSKADASTFKENFKALEKEKKLNSLSSSDVDLAEFESNSIDIQLLCVDEKTSKKNPKLKALLLSRTLFELDLSIVRLRKPFSSVPPSSFDFVAAEAVDETEASLLESLAFQPIRIFEDPKNKIPLKSFQVPTLEKLRQIVSQLDPKKTILDAYIDIFSKDPNAIQKQIEKEDPLSWKKVVESVRKIETERGLKPSSTVTVAKDIIRPYETVLYKSFPFLSIASLRKMGFEVPKDLESFYDDLLTKPNKKKKMSRSDEESSDQDRRSIQPSLARNEILPSPSPTSPIDVNVEREERPEDENERIPEEPSPRVRQISFVRSEIDQILEEMKTSDKELHCVLKRMKTCSFEQAKSLEAAINDDIKQENLETAALETISSLKVDRIKIYDFAEFLSYRYRALIGKNTGILSKLNREIESPENEEKKRKCKIQIDNLSQGFKASRRVLLRWIRHPRVIDMVFPVPEFYALDPNLQTSVEKIASDNLERKMRDESISEEDFEEIDPDRLKTEIGQVLIDGRYSVMKNMIMNKLDVSPVTVRNESIGGVTDTYVQTVKPAKEKSLIDQRQQLQNEYITRQNDVRQYSILKSIIRNPLFQRFFSDSVVSKRVNSLFEKMTETLIKDLINLWDVGVKIASSFQDNFAPEESLLKEKPLLPETTLFRYIHRFLSQSESETINHWYKLCEQSKELKNSKRDSVRSVESVQCSVVDSIVEWISSGLLDVGIDFSYVHFASDRKSPSTALEFLDALKSSKEWRRDLESNFSSFLEQNTSFATNYIDARSWISSVRFQLSKREPEARFRSWYRKGVDVIVKILNLYLVLLEDSIQESVEFELLSRISSDSFKNPGIDYSQVLIRKLDKGWSQFFGISVQVPESLLEWADFVQETNAWKRWLSEDRQFSFDSTFSYQMESKDTFSLIKNLISYRLVPSPMICSDVKEPSLIQHLKTQMNYEFLYHWPDRLLRSFQFFSGSKESFLFKRGVPDGSFSAITLASQAQDENQFPSWTMVTDHQNSETRLFFRSPKVELSLSPKDQVAERGHLFVGDLGISDQIETKSCFVSTRISLLLNSFFDLGFKDPFAGTGFDYDDLRSFFAEFFPDIDLLEGSVRRQREGKNGTFEFMVDSQVSFLCDAFNRWKKLPIVYEENKINTIDLLSDRLTIDGKIRDRDGTFVSTGTHAQELDEKTAIKFSKDDENFVWVHGDDLYSRLRGQAWEGFGDKKIDRFLGFVSYKLDVWPRDQKIGKNKKNFGFTDSGLAVEPKTKNSYNKTTFDPYPKAGHLWHLHLECPNPRNRKAWFKETQKIKKPGKGENIDSWRGFVASVVEMDSFFQPLSTNNGFIKDFSSRSENPSFFSGKIPYLPIVPAIFKVIIESRFIAKERGLESSTVLLVRLNRVKRLGLLPENVLVYILRRYFDFALVLPRSSSEEFVDVRGSTYAPDLFADEQYRIYTTVERNSDKTLSDRDRWEEIDETEPFLFRPMPTQEEYWRMVQYYLFYFFEHQTRNFDKTSLNDIPSLTEFLFADKELKLSGLADLGPAYFTSFERTLFTKQYIEKIRSKDTIPKTSGSTFSTIKMDIKVSSSEDLDDAMISSKANALSLSDWLNKNLDPSLSSKITLKGRQDKPKGYVPLKSELLDHIVYSDLYVDKESFDDKRTVKKRQVSVENESILELKQREEEIPEPKSQIVGSLLIDPKEYRLLPLDEKQNLVFKHPISSERSNLSPWLWKEMNRQEKMAMIRLSRTFENKNYKQTLVQLYKKYDPQAQRYNRSFRSIPFSKLTDPEVFEFVKTLETMITKYAFLFPPTKGWDSIGYDAKINPYVFDSNRALSNIELAWKKIDKGFTAKVSPTKEQEESQTSFIQSITRSLKADFAKSLIVFANPEPRWLGYTSPSQPTRIDWNGSKTMQEHTESLQNRRRYGQDDFVRSHAYWSSLLILDSLLEDERIPSASLKDSLDLLNKIATTFHIGQRTVVVTNAPTRPILFEIVPPSERKRLHPSDPRSASDLKDISLSEEQLADLGIFIGGEPRVDRARGRKFGTIETREIDVGNTDSDAETTKVFYSKKSSFYRLVASGTWKKRGFFGETDLSERVYIAVNNTGPMNKKDAKRTIAEISEALSVRPAKETDLVESSSAPLQDNPEIERKIVFPLIKEAKFRKLYQTMLSLESIASVRSQ